MQAQAASQLLAEASEGDSGLTAERREQLEQQVMQALQQLAANGGLEGASQMLQQAAQSGQLPSDPEAREQALQELAERLQSECNRLGQLRSRCQGNCPGGKPGEGNCEGNGKDGEDGDGNPGRGGVTRGRGDAKITFGDESDEQGALFRETVLPPGFMDDAQSMGFSLTTPEVNPADSAARAESRLADPASGMETWQRTVRPRHRSVVRQFFDSGESTSDSE
jgi:hypothetical protein